MALEHDLTVVTRDRRDFELARIRAFDPWTERR
jgi:predicted nucleic acid-binding protein